MNQNHLNQLLEMANKYIKNPDVIIDPYDMTYVWVSKKQCDLLNYSQKEQINKSIALNTQLINADSSKMAVDDIHAVGEIKDKELILTTKKGEEMTANTSTSTIIFNNQPYLIGKIIQIKNK